jgi:hypothetical protein
MSVADELKSEALAFVEGLVKKQLDKHFDAVVASLAGKLKEKIPGKYDDILIDMAQMQLVPELKADLYALVDKIYKEA